MSAEVAILAAVTLIASAWLTGAVRRLALSRGLLDVPNARSSHTTATPRGGGVAIVATSSVAFLLLSAAGRLDVHTLLALAGGLAVAAVGFIDDQRPLSAGVRLAVHLTAACWAVGWLKGLPPLPLPSGLIDLGAGGYLLGALAIVWVLNLFNFMDGIDGIAASEAVFIAWGGALLALGPAGLSGSAAAAIVLGAACLGFLRWNWPPARIFMGDVGSGYLGYVIAVLALAAAHDEPAALFSWLILGGAFFADATITLVRRSLRGERPHQAHRSHAYQWLARRWGSHRRTTLVVLCINLLWLLPCAVLATRQPRAAAWIAAAALLPVALLALVAGAGRSEENREFAHPPR